MSPSPHPEATRPGADGLSPVVYDVLAAPPDERMTRIARLAADLAGAATGLIAISDTPRQIFHVHGCPDAGLQGAAFLAHTLAANRAVVVADARMDPRFAARASAEEAPAWRFYAGIPLHARSGDALGILCVSDSAPRTLSETALARLEALAALVVVEMESARHPDGEGDARGRPQPSATVPSPTRSLPDIVVRYDRNLQVLYANEAAKAALAMPHAGPGRGARGGPGKTSGGMPEWISHVRHVLERGDVLQVPVTFPDPDGSVLHRDALFVPEHDASGSVAAVLLCVRNATGHSMSERRYRALVDATSSLVWRMSADGRSDLELVGGTLVTGRPPDGSASNWLGFVHPEDRSRTEAAWAEAVRAETAFDAEYRLRLPDGHIRWFAVRAVPVRTEDGRVVEWVGANTDVTDRKNAEAALQRSEARFRSLVQNSSEIITLMHADGRILYQSDSIEPITGYGPATLLGHSALDYIHEDDRAEVLRVLSSVSEAGRGSTGRVQLRFQKADGSWKWFESVATNMLDDPNVGAVVVNSREITEHRRATEALRESVGRYHALSHLVQSFAYAYDVPHDGARPTLAWITGSVEEVLGRPASSFVGMAWGAPIRPADQPLTDERLAAALRGESRVDDLRVMGGDGTELWIRFVSEPEVDPETGRVVRIYGAGQDVTEQKMHEAELVEARVLAEQARARAEEMARLKDAFLANMSHEIRTPLTSILGFADLLHEGADASERALVEHIQTGAQRLRDTLTSVLELAQLQADHVALKTVPVALLPLVEGTVQVLSSQAQTQEVSLTSRVAPAHLAVQAERGALGRILTNLVGNAVKFTPAGGAVHLSAEDAGDHVVIRVRDTGVGISPSFLPHLFDDFRQESQGLGRSHEGSGLGLAITKRLVELMDGTIAVESTKGAGTTVTVHLPTAPGALAGAAAEESVPNARSTGPRVLVVEDDASTRLYAQHVLKSLRVEQAGTAEEALAQVASSTGTFDVALIDVHLGGGLSGVDLLPLLRELPPCHATRFVAMTAYALPGDAERFLGAGFDGYIAKPFTRDALWAILKTEVGPLL